ELKKPAALRLLAPVHPVGEGHVGDARIGAGGFVVVAGADGIAQLLLHLGGQLGGAAHVGRTPLPWRALEEDRAAGRAPAATPGLFGRPPWHPVALEGPPGLVAPRRRGAASQAGAARSRARPCWESVLRDGPSTVRQDAARDASRRPDNPRAG